MIATVKYYEPTGSYPRTNPKIFQESQSTTAHIPGLEWTDTNNHTYRAVIVDMYFTSFIYKTVNFKYEIHMKPSGSADWLDVAIATKTEQINQDNVIEISSGLMVDLAQYMVNDELVLPEGFWESHMPQFDYFVALIGKNIFNVPVDLYSMMLNRILTLEGLTLE